MFTGLQYHGCCPQYGLGGVAQGLLPGQSGHDAAVCQRLNEGVHKGGAAAGHAAGRINELFHSASRCDGLFFDLSLAVGETLVGTDGTELSFVSDRETVETPAGVFEDCQVWITKCTDSFSRGTVIAKNWYKSGVGIVRHEQTVDGFTDVRVLKAYHIAGGKGLLPMAEGNTWEYADTYNPDVMISSLMFTVNYADDEKAIVASENFIERLKYDENSWLDMIQQIRNEYTTHGKGRCKLLDVSHAIERAEALAKTPMEKMFMSLDSAKTEL